MKTFTLISTALVLGGSIFSAANAAPPSDLPTAVVTFGDLDASHPAGKEELYRRVTRAAHAVCRSLDPAASGKTNLQLIPQYKACIDQAVLGAVAKINLRDFTDYVASRTQKPASTGIQLASR